MEQIPSASEVHVKSGLLPCPGGSFGPSRKYTRTLAPATGTSEPSTTAIVRFTVLPVTALAGSGEKSTKTFAAARAGVPGQATARMPASSAALTLAASALRRCLELGVTPDCSP
jgi:hypothetical protein